MVNYLDPIISYLDKLVLVTIGLKDIILKVQNLLTLYSILQEKKLKDVIVFKVSKLLIHLVEVLDQVWEHYLLVKLKKNILHRLLQHFPFSHLQKYLILLLNPITRHFLYINLLKTLMLFKLFIMKLYMISVSELLNLQHQVMVILTISYLLLCLVSLVLLDSQVNLTPI